jgi:hypothetical protein
LFLNIPKSCFPTISAGRITGRLDVSRGRNLLSIDRRRIIAACIPRWSHSLTSDLRSAAITFLSFFHTIVGGVTANPRAKLFTVQRKRCFFLRLSKLHSVRNESVRPARQTTPHLLSLGLPAFPMPRFGRGLILMRRDVTRGFRV